MKVNMKVNRKVRCWIQIVHYRGNTLSVTGFLMRIVSPAADTLKSCYLVKHIIFLLFSVTRRSRTDVGHLLTESWLALT